MRLLVLLAGQALLSLPASAIPNAVGGFLAQVESPLNNIEIGDRLLDPDVWESQQALPGTWHQEAPIAEVQGSYLAARPKVFGLPAVMVQARHRNHALDSLSITFADAGSYFGYLDETLPSGLNRRQQQKELLRRITAKQRDFSLFFRRTEASLRATLQKLADKRPKDSTIGKSRTLRADTVDYRRGDLVLRLVVGTERLIRLLIHPAGSASRA